MLAAPPVRRGDVGSAFLCPVPDTQDLHAARTDAIHDDVGPNSGQFARARGQAGASPLGQVFEPVAGGDELDGDATGRGRVPFPDVSPYPCQVGQRRGGKGYGHGGGDASASVPQDNSQRRTLS